MGWAAEAEEAGKEKTEHSPRGEEKHQKQKTLFFLTNYCFLTEHEKEIFWGRHVF